MTVAVISFSICIADPIADFMELQLPPSIEFRAYFIAFGVGNFIICMLIEKLFTGNETVRIKTEEASKHYCTSRKAGMLYATACNIGILVYCM